jgi:opacity protein-like surface antigen
MFKNANNQTEVTSVGRMAGLIAFALLLAAPSAFAQRSADRAGTAEFGLVVMDTQGVNVTGQYGTGLDIDSDIAWGLVGGYNFTDHFALGGEWTWSNPDYVATRRDVNGGLIDRVSATASVDSFILKATFNFFNGPVTPYVEAGAGWIHVDSNIANGPPQTGCWWDPWWGYVCTNFYDTYSDTRGGYVYGFGVRWDVSDEIVLRGLWGQTDLETNYASGDIKYDNYRVEIAWKF